MKEGEAEELIMAYLDPAKQKTAEKLAQSIQGNQEEIKGFVKGICSHNLQIKEISALFLKRSLALSLGDKSIDKVAYQEILNRLYREIQCNSTKSDNLLLESVSSIKEAMQIEDILDTVNMEVVEESAKRAAEGIELFEIDREKIKILTVLNRYTEKYRNKERSDALYQEINYLISCTKHFILEVIKKIIDQSNRNPTDTVQMAFINTYQMLQNIITHDLPDYYEENIEIFTAGLYSNITGSDHHYSRKELLKAADERTIILLRIRISCLMISKYSDAYNTYTVFVENLAAVYELSEKMDDGVQFEFIQYLGVLLSNPTVLNMAIPVTRGTYSASAPHALENSPLNNSIVKMLINKIEIYDEIGDSEYVQSLLEGDPLSLKDYSSGILKELIYRDSALISAILSHPPTNQLLYLFLFLVRTKYKIPANLSSGYAAWIDRAVATVVQPSTRKDTIEISISCAVIISALEKNQIEVERILNRSDEIICKLSDNLLINKSYIILIYLETISTLCLYRDLYRDTDRREPERPFCIPIETLKHLTDTLTKGDLNEYIGKSLFHLIKISQTEETEYFAEAASSLLIDQIDAVGNTRLAKTLWDIITFHSINRTHCNPLLIPAQLIVYCINNNLDEYYTYALQLLGIINTLYEIDDYANMSKSILSNNTLWESRGLVSSLTYLAVSLKNSTKPVDYSINPVVKYIVKDTSAISVLGRHLNSYSMMELYSSTEPISQLLLRYIEILMKTEYKEEVDRLIGLFLQKPSVQEEETGNSIKILEAYAAQRPDAPPEARTRIQDILHKLKQRRPRIRDAPWTLSMIDSIFKRDYYY